MIKVIHAAPIPCRCYDKLAVFDQDTTLKLGIGSIVECDCGQRYTLADSQREGQHWVKQVIPRPAPKRGLE